MYRVLVAFALFFVLLTSIGCSTPKQDSYVKDLEARVSNLQTSIRDLKVENERLASEYKTAKSKNDRDEALIANLEKRIEDLLKSLREKETLLRSLYKQAELDIDKLTASLKSAGFDNPDPADNTATTSAIGDGITWQKPVNGAPGKLIIAGKVLFPSGEYKLSANGKKALLKIAKILKANIGNSVLRIDGHTDNKSVRHPNNKGIIDNAHLSALRAHTVYTCLVKFGKLNPNRVFFAGWGKNKPIESNKTEAGRRKTVG